MVGRKRPGPAWSCPSGETLPPFHQMNKLLMLLPVAATMVTSGCVTPATPPRYGSAWQPPAIWERSAALPLTQRIQVQHVPAGRVRIYPDLSGRPITPRPTARPAALYTRREDYAANPNYARTVLPSEARRLSGPGTATVSANVTAPSAPQPRRELVSPARVPLAAFREPARRPVTTLPMGSSANRLGLASMAKIPRAPLNQPVKNLPSREQPVPLRPGELPYALPVTGRTGFARMPGHPGLPEIDVRGILPGTPAEIPDPAGKAGETIQFRVP